MKSVCSAFLILSWTAAAALLPEPVFPAGVGVNIHFVSGQGKDLDMIAAAGFKFIRMDFAWDGIERAKGQYNWSAYEELTASLEKRGLSAIYILDYSNPLYEVTVTSRNPLNDQEQQDLASPQRPESVAAFARWAAAAAEHFRGRPIIWEIWNEPNISFWKPKADVKQYTELALATCKAIRQAVPEATIIAPATSEFPWTFLERFFASGVLEYLDAVSVHPYRSYQRPPESAGPDYQKLRALIDRYTPAGTSKKMPIISGEWGYATHTRGVSLETQAAFLARQQLFNLLSGIPISIWYDWKNDGSDRAEREHNFGTVTENLQPKPAYLALQTLTRTLAGYRIDRRLALPDDKDYVLLCVKAGGDDILAAWTLGEPHAIRLDLNPSSTGQVTATTATGESFSPKTELGRLVLDVSAAPAYFTLKGVKLKL